MGDPNSPADNDNLQTRGRKDNAAQPLNAADDHGGPERYPPVRQDDAIDPGAETRSFGSQPDNPEPRQGAGDGGPAPATNEGRLGPEGDPVEGKR